MPILKFKHFSQHPSVLLALLLLALAGVLFFGLRPKDYDFSNKVSLIEGRGGLQFEKYSMAHTQPFDADMIRQLENLERFTLCLNLWPRPEFDDGFGLIAVMHAGSDADQLIIGQWKSYIIAMNGDDYAHKRRLPRISFDTAKILDPDQQKSGIQLALSSGQQGTRLYVNGRLVKEKPKMTLKLPIGKESRLIIGNSPYGSASWQGNIYGLALYPGIISDKDIEYVSKSGAGNSYPEDFGHIESFFQYDFKEIKEKKVTDHSGNKIDLYIPDRVVPVQKKILAWPWHDFKADKGFYLDVAVNLLGFVPLGFLFAVVLMQSGLVAAKQAFLVTVMFCFLLSLGIEVGQAWLPSRSSSLVDLVMNTMGAGVGAGALFIRQDLQDLLDFISLRERL